MRLVTLDWIVIVVSLLIAFVPALMMARRAGQNTAEFFTSGRAAPWWLIGISMVATTFSTDTPNLVTDLVRQGGVAGNWAWWAFLLTGMATVMFYARMWRRSGVLTDLEFYEIRYSGRAASLVRGFRAVYLGLVFNVVIMATVNLAAVKIASMLLGWEMERTLLWCAGLNIGFAVISGLWGVLVIDLIQFGIAMTGAFAAAWFSLQQPEVGGLTGLFAKLPAESYAFLPDSSNPATFLTIFILPLTVQWWSVWYPGAEPGGGSYIAQRMLASKSEKDALLGTLFFNVAHYGMRTWPWIVVALCSLLVFPTLPDIARAFPNVPANLIGHDIAYPAMLTFLPAGWLGLMIAGLLSAYISTIVTHLNWGTSYLVHDFYRRFVRADATERHYVMVGRLVTAGLMLVAAFVTRYINTASTGFTLLLSIGAGTGLLYLLRWYWWRVNAAAEIAAMVASFGTAIGFHLAKAQGMAISGTTSLLGTVAVTTIVWIAAAYLGPQTDAKVLESFYRLVRPAGPGWTSVRTATGLLPSSDSIPQAMLGWIAGIFLVYGALFGVGATLAGNTTLALLWLGVFLVSGVVVLRVLQGFWRPTPAR
ncbi:MAG: sodium:solute symporter family protein [Gemmatimonadaceae bacterium]|jgi:SSS family solute:Na+ symporter